MENKKLLLQINKKEKQIEELLVLIDTLQTNLRSAVTHIPEGKKGEIINVQSYKWCTNWRPSDLND
jgi:hypothetical protein